MVNNQTKITGLKHSIGRVDWHQLAAMIRHESEESLVEYRLTQAIKGE